MEENQESIWHAASLKCLQLNKCERFPYLRWWCIILQIGKLLLWTLIKIKLKYNGILCLLFVYIPYNFCPFGPWVATSHGKILEFLKFLEKSWNFDQNWGGSWNWNSESGAKIEFDKQILRSYGSMSLQRLHGSFSNSKLSVCQLRSHGLLWHGHGKVMEKAWNFVAKISGQPWWCISENLFIPKEMWTLLLKDVRYIKVQKMLKFTFKDL